MQRKTEWKDIKYFKKEEEQNDNSMCATYRIHTSCCRYHFYFTSRFFKMTSVRMFLRKDTLDVNLTFIVLSSSYNIHFSSWESFSTIPSHSIGYVMNQNHAILFLLLSIMCFSITIFSLSIRRQYGQTLNRSIATAIILRENMK